MTLASPNKLDVAAIFARLRRTIGNRKSRLLFVSADPSGGVPIPHAYEYADLKTALKSRAIAVDQEVETTRESFQKALRQCRPMMLHISCHGVISSGEPQLLLEDEYKNTDGVEPEWLVQSLRFLSVDGEESPLRMVVLSVCNSDIHAKALSDAFPELCVVGFTKAIGQEHVRQFCRVLYEHLGSDQGFKVSCDNALLVLPDAVAQQVVRYGPSDLCLPRGGRPYRRIAIAALGLSLSLLLGAAVYAYYYGLVPRDPSVNNNDLRPIIEVRLSAPSGPLPVAVVTALTGTPFTCAEETPPPTSKYPVWRKCPTSRKPYRLCEVDLMNLCSVEPIMGPPNKPCKRREIDNAQLREFVLDESIEGLQRALPFFLFRRQGETPSGDVTHPMCIKLVSSVGVDDPPPGLTQQTRLLGRMGPCTDELDGTLDLHTFDVTPASERPVLEDGELAAAVTRNLRQQLTRGNVISTFESIPFVTEFVVDFTRDRVATSLGHGALRSAGKEPIQRGNTVFAVFLDEGKELEMLFRVCNTSRAAGWLTKKIEDPCHQLVKAGRHWPSAPTATGTELFIRSWRER